MSDSGSRSFETAHRSQPQEEPRSKRSDEPESHQQIDFVALNAQVAEKARQTREQIVGTAQAKEEQLKPVQEFFAEATSLSLAELNSQKPEDVQKVTAMIQSGKLSPFEGFLFSELLHEMSYEDVIKKIDQNRLAEVPRKSEDILDYPSEFFADEDGLVQGVAERFDRQGNSHHKIILLFAAPEIGPNGEVIFGGKVLNIKDHPFLVGRGALSDKEDSRVQQEALGFAQNINWVAATENNLKKQSWKVANNEALTRRTPPPWKMFVASETGPKWNELSKVDPTAD